MHRRSPITTSRAARQPEFGLPASAVGNSGPGFPPKIARDMRLRYFSLIVLLRPGSLTSLASSYFLFRPIRSPTHCTTTMDATYYHLPTLLLAEAPSQVPETLAMHNVVVQVWLTLLLPFFDLDTSCPVSGSGSGSASHRFASSQAGLRPHIRCLYFYLHFSLALDCRPHSPSHIRTCGRLSLSRRLQRSSTHDCAVAVHCTTYSHF